MKRKNKPINEYIYYKKIKAHEKAIERCQFITSDKFITLGEDKKAVVWNTDGDKIIELLDHRAWVFGIDIQNEHILTYGSDHHIIVWDDFIIVNKLQHLDLIHFAFFYKDNIVISASKDGCLKIWNYKLNIIVKEYFYD